MGHSAKPQQFAMSAARNQCTAALGPMDTLAIQRVPMSYFRLLTYRRFSTASAAALVVFSVMLLAARSATLSTRTQGHPILSNCTAVATGVCSQRMSTVTKAADATSTHQALNVLGKPLQCCCTSPMTGYYRDGFCRTGGGDYGAHVVCAQVTAEFLDYTRSQGNDLSTPAPHYGFPGLKPGDKWCLCASRWKEAADAGKAPPLFLSGCHIRALDYVDMALLKQYALPEDGQQ